MKKYLSQDYIEELANANGLTPTPSVIRFADQLAMYIEDEIDNQKSKSQNVPRTLATNETEAT